MTGREWYIMRWNAALMGLSCYAVCVLRMDFAFLQPDKTTSDQNRILPKQWEESQLVAVLFPVFSGCRAALTNPLGRFRN